MAGRPEATIRRCPWHWNLPVLMWCWPLRPCLALRPFFTLRCRVHSALSPLVSLCSVSLVLAAAGVAGVLRPAVWAVYLLCFVLGAAALRQKWQDRKALCTPGAVLFWTMSAAFAVYFALRQPLFTDFDEMSFWGHRRKAHP